MGRCCGATRVDTAPNEEENAALAFHFEAPDATAPQTALLGVNPDPAEPWDADLVTDLVREIHSSARLRAVDPDLVPTVRHVLPALLLTSNVGGAPNGDTISTTRGA